MVLTEISSRVLQTSVLQFVPIYNSQIVQRMGEQQGISLIGYHLPWRVYIIIQVKEKEWQKDFMGNKIKFNILKWRLIDITKSDSSNSWRPKECDLNQWSKDSKWVLGLNSNRIKKNRIFSCCKNLCFIYILPPLENGHRSTTKSWTKR